MSRSLWKGNYISKFFFRDSINTKNIIKVWDRSSVVPYNMLNKSVLVYTGRAFKKIFITRQKIGYKFGEFCYTRTPRNRLEQQTRKPIQKKKK